MPTEWYLQDTKYFSGYEKEEIQETYQVFDEFLSQSPEAYLVTVDSLQKIIIIQSTADYNKRRILFKENDIQWGDLITHEGQQWLVTERPFNNRIYEKSKMTLCGNKMVFEKEIEGVISDWDSLGNPIYSTEPTTTTVEFPCVIEDISSLETPTGKKINVPEGDMALLIPYTTDTLIQLNSEFDMFNETYRITGIDRSKVLDGKGILMLVAERTTK